MAPSIRYLLLLLLSGLLWDCASPTPPTGGPRDEDPPELDSTAFSTPNYQTNFQKQTIELTFDEWVQLNNPNTQVIVSPPLEFQFNVRLKKRTVLFEFDEKEQLRDSATYTINFGEAVQDLTERNPAEDLRFVFSTGPYLDSLRIAGQVIDAFTNEPVKDIRVMLYDNLADSVVRTERPFYFAKTDETGRFLIENVKSGDFKLFALEDANLNYKYDQVTERIAFVGAPISVGADSTGEWLLRLFQPLIPLQVAEVANKRFGLINIVFGGGKPSPERLVLTAVGGPDTLLYEYELDSVKVWYPDASAAPWSLLVQSGETLRDTIETAALTKEDWQASARLAWRSPAGKGSAETLNPDRPAKLNFNYPIVFWDTSRIQLLEDTLRIPVRPQLMADTSGIRNLVLDYRWKEDLVYRLQILPGGVSDIFGQTNQDTLVRDYRVSSRKNLGILTVKFQDMVADSAYLIEIVQLSQIIEQFWVSGEKEWEKKLTSLPPGNYSVRVTLDLNKNGKWDTGDYDSLRQPEPILLKDLGNLRANWEVEGEVSLLIGNFNVPVEVKTGVSGVRR